MTRETLASGTPVEVVRTEGATLGLVVAPDIFGLRPLFDDLVARLAAEHGWSVAAVEPFPGLTPDADIDTRFAAISGLDDEAVLGDLAAAGDLLDTPRRALIGFCMGGMYANKATSTGAFANVASFYGMIRLPALWKGEKHREPLDLLAEAPSHVGLLAIVGGKDPYTPAEDIAALRNTPRATVVEYPEADHGFVHDAARPSHRPDDAADAWRRVVAHVEGA